MTVTLAASPSDTRNTLQNFLEYGRPVPRKDGAALMRRILEPHWNWQSPPHVFSNENAEKGKIRLIFVCRQPMLEHAVQPLLERIEIMSVAALGKTESLHRTATVRALATPCMPTA
jgi:hypothetical protein